MTSESNHRPVTEIAIAVVHRSSVDQFLVGVRPPGTPLAGKHEFPGGKIRPGETPEAAAIRECAEETGLTILLHGAYSHHQETYDHGVVLLHFFDAQVAATDNADVVRAPWQWVPREALATLDFPSGNQSLVEQLLQQGSLAALDAPPSGPRRP